MMNDRRDGGQVPPGPAGLCMGCAHVQLVTTGKGSRFYLCRLSFTDPTFPRYPPTPVLVCPGFTPGTAGEPSSGG